VSLEVISTSNTRNIYVIRTTKVNRTSKKKRSNFRNNERRHFFSYVTVEKSWSGERSSDKRQMEKSPPREKSFHLVTSIQCWRSGRRKKKRRIVNKDVAIAACCGNDASANIPTTTTSYAAVLRYALAPN